MSSIPYSHQNKIRTKLLLTILEESKSNKLRIKTMINSCNLLQTQEKYKDIYVHLKEEKFVQQKYIGQWKQSNKTQEDSGSTSLDETSKMSTFKVAKRLVVSKAKLSSSNLNLDLGNLSQKKILKNTERVKEFTITNNNEIGFDGFSKQLTVEGFNYLRELSKKLCKTQKRLGNSEARKFDGYDTNVSIEIPERLTNLQQVNENSPFIFIQDIVDNTKTDNVEVVKNKNVDYNLYQNKSESYRRMVKSIKVLSLSKDNLNSKKGSKETKNVLSYGFRKRPSKEVNEIHCSSSRQEKRQKDFFIKLFDCSEGEEEQIRKTHKTTDLHIVLRSMSSRSCDKELEE